MEQIISHINHFIIALFLLFAQGQVSIKQPLHLVLNVVLFITMIIVWKLQLYSFFIMYLIILLLTDYFIIMRHFKYDAMFGMVAKAMSLVLVAEHYIVKADYSPWLLLPLIVAGGFFPFHSSQEYRKADNNILAGIEYYILICVGILADKINLKAIILPNMLNHTFIVIALPIIGLLTTRNTSILVSQQLKILYALYFVDKFQIMLPSLVACMAVAAISQREHSKIINNLLSFIVNIMMIVAIQGYASSDNHLFYLMLGYDLIVFLKFKFFKKPDFSFRTVDAVISVLAMVLIIYEHSLKITPNYKYILYVITASALFSFVTRKFITKYTFDFSLIKLLDITEKHTLNFINNINTNVTYTELTAALRIVKFRAVSRSICFMLIALSLMIMCII
ncbi:MAG: hypothetical protein J0G32_00610 [Alphaproteobacteria bacterium]|nr:hypothetical protein [Alphaproteobacteria bacterium]OJV14255.1 MAG: hypothetical protein BGO27_02005 [Alphaproteobacteria bacterium 33-17]